MDKINTGSDTVFARRGDYGRFKFECWGERDGQRLPGTVYVRDLMQLDDELAMSGLQTIPDLAIEALRRCGSLDCDTYAGSVMPVSAFRPGGGE